MCHFSYLKRDLFFAQKKRGLLQKVESSHLCDDKSLLYFEFRKTTMSLHYLQSLQMKLYFSVNLFIDLFMHWTGEEIFPLVVFSFSLKRREVTP